MRESLIKGGTQEHKSANGQRAQNVIEIERGGCYYNTNELFSYQAPSQEHLRMFLFSSSERFSTFIAREDKKNKKIEKEREDT
jgi:hypothetical protein